jgi:hypothetical protein
MPFFVGILGLSCLSWRISYDPTMDLYSSRAGICCRQSGVPDVFTQAIHKLMLPQTKVVIAAVSDYIEMPTGAGKMAVLWVWWLVNNLGAVSNPFRIALPRHYCPVFQFFYRFCLGQHDELSDIFQRGYSVTFSF